MQILTPHQKAAIDLSRSISLTANAGSGKTFVLAKRFLEVLINTNTPLHKVAAITFTDKAAGELYRKISMEIENLISNDSNEKLKKKLKLIRSKLVSAKISTIHSFCLDTLKQFPVEANLDANFMPIDQNRSDELIEIAIEETIGNSLLDNKRSEILKELIRLFGSKNKFAEVLKKLVAQRKNVIDVQQKIYSKRIDEIAEFFQTSFETILEQLFSIDEGKFLNNLTLINEVVLNSSAENAIAKNIKIALDDFQRKLDPLSKLDIISNLASELCTASGSIRKQGYLTSKLRNDNEIDVSYVENFIQEIKFLNISKNANQENNSLARTGKYLIEVFQYANDNYEQKKHENSLIDFEDILLKTKNLFELEAVREKISSQYDFLLVDEYQDTNELQYRIFLPILDNLKSGNLFVVGDEKQSIYRFRDAELEVFDLTKSNIQDKHPEGSLLSLPDSFRMSPRICLFTNVLFKNLFASKNKLYNEVEQSEIICAVDSDKEGSIEILLPIEDSEITEAQLVAQRILILIKRLSDEGKSWSDIAVLVRKRNSFKILEQTFSDYGIPYSIIGGKGFYQRQSIYDIYNYFSFLLNPDDDAALVGVLRSPFFSLSDSIIFEITLLNNGSLFNKLKIAAKSDKKLTQILQILDNNLTNTAKSDAVEILRNILKFSDYLSVIASRTNAEQELANIDKLVSITLQFTNDGFNSLYDYVNFLKDAITKLESTPQADTESNSKGVNILTIHQAKGLEYEAVFIFNCDDYSKVNSIKAKDVTINKSYGLLTKTPLNDDHFGEYKSASIVNAFNLIESKKELAEIKRLFYVAVTRAKGYLFISSGKAKDSFNKYSFMNLLQQGLNSDLSLSSIVLKDTLKFLKYDNGNYFNEEKIIELNIPIINELKFEQEIDQIITAEYSDKKFLLNKISDSTKTELISAAKFTTYLQCPVKYQLRYELGLTADILDSDTAKISFKKFNEDGNELSENGERKESEFIDDIALIKGKIIHSALEKSIKINDIEPFIKTYLKNLISVNGNNKTIIEEIISEIKDTLILFFQSKEFFYLNSFKKYKNEMEVYKKESDYFLHGILDKVIFDSNKIIVIDYKTDNKESIQKAINRSKYINQIKFYLYIIDSLFENYSSIEGRIIFLNSIEENIIIKYDPTITNEIKKKLTEFIMNMRKNNFIPDYNHCPDCLYSPDKRKCILNNL